mgnify:CR=1 FL=1
MKKYFTFLSVLFILAGQLTSCKPNVEDNTDDVKPVDDVKNYGTPYKLPRPAGFPNPLIPADNPLTEEGILLGRMLFYDNILSGDSSMSCSTCHKQENAFATNNAFEKGIHGKEGNRSTMPLFNLVWINYGFFWDGRAQTLEQQVVMPVEDKLEMDLSWGEALVRLQRHPKYPAQFKKAFGSEKVTKENAAKAMAQFLRTIVSVDSKFDMAERLGLAGKELTPSELRGMQIYLRDPKDKGMGEYISGGSCDHCHGNPNLFILQPMDAATAYRNNGIDPAATYSDFKDIGYAKVKPGLENFGKFKAPSLRNVELTAPYMHDGRFKTLEEVIDHYNNGGHASPTLDQEMASLKFKETEGKLQLSEQDKKDLIAFLKSLTDTKLTTTPAYSSPFK